MDNIHWIFRKGVYKVYEYFHEPVKLQKYEYWIDRY